MKQLRLLALILLMSAGLFGEAAVVNHVMGVWQSLWGKTHNLTIPSTTAGNALVVFVSSQNTATWTTPTCSGCTFTLITSYTATQYQAHAWWATNIPAGVTSISTTITEDGNFWVLSAVEVSGVDQSAVDTSGSIGHGYILIAPPDAVPTLTTTAAGLILGQAANGWCSVSSPGWSYTGSLSVVDFASFSCNGYLAASSFSRVTTAGGVYEAGANTDAANNYWAVVSVALKASVGAAVVRPRRIIVME